MIFNKDVLLLIQKLKIDKSKDVRVPVEDINLPLAEVPLISSPLKKNVNSENNVDNGVLKGKSLQEEKNDNNNSTEILTSSENSKKLDDDIQSEEKQDQEELKNVETSKKKLEIKIEENKEDHIDDEISPGTAANIRDILNKFNLDDKSDSLEKDENENETS